MPKSGKKGKKKGGKKKKKTIVGAENIIQRLYKCYERNCALTDSQMCVGIKKALKACLENTTVLEKFIFESVVPENEGDLPVLIEPLLAAIRQDRYVYIKDLHIWDYPMSIENAATLALLIERQCYPLRVIELMDCLLEPYSAKRLSRSFNICESLTHVVLDYNEFGDEGCKDFCKGLEKNITLLSLSMCYCDLGPKSGHYIGDLVSKTAVREVYLNGNNLESDGATEIIKQCTEQAEYEAVKRAEEAKRKEEEEAEKALREKELGYRSSEFSDKEYSPPGSGKKKKKKGKKKKKKEPPPPPPVGPWIHKLHINDNGIDGLLYGKEFAPLEFMRGLKKLLMYSECFEELDLDDNLIGDLGGKEIQEGLEYRKEETKLGGIKVLTTHRMKTDTFNSIVKLGSGLKKKKKKGGKKKKKK